VLVVLRILICVFWISVSCLGSDQSQFMAPFMILMCRLAQILFLSLAVNS